MKRAFFSGREWKSLLRGLSLVSWAILFTSLLHAQCGKERWSVKTGTDSDAGLVDLTTVKQIAITDLRNLSAPHPIPKNSRVQPTETTVWEVNATLNVYKQESDSDYHLVLVDDTGNTMIAEIPAPACVQGNSPFSQAIANARSEFDAQFTASSSFQAANTPVRVRGVGMFDFIHNPPQRGVAPNGIEKSPVRGGCGLKTMSSTG